jgi:hypothetical protein
MIEMPLINLPKEADGRVIPPKKQNLQPRSTRSKVKGHLTVYAAFIPDPSDPSDTPNGNVASSSVEPVAQAVQAIDLNGSEVGVVGGGSKYERS